MSGYGIYCVAVSPLLGHPHQLKPILAHFRFFILLLNIVRSNLPLPLHHSPAIVLFNTKIADSSIRSQCITYNSTNRFPCTHRSNSIKAPPLSLCAVSFLYQKPFSFNRINSDTVAQYKLQNPVIEIKIY